MYKNIIDPINKQSVKIDNMEGKSILKKYLKKYLNGGVKYLGGKHRLGKKISDVLKKLCPPHKCKYIEPFCGGLGVFRHMTDYDCTASDIHPDIIALWKAIKNNTFKPPSNKITDVYYNKVKNMKSPSPLKGFIGFLCSWNGMYFAGYAKYGEHRDVKQEALNDIKKIGEKIKKKNVKIYQKSYNEYNPRNSLIYCDPPYKNTIGYSGTKEFDHNKFWKKMRKWSKNNIVVISEQTAPKDFVHIWKKKYTRSRGFKSNQKKTIEEKLFVHNTVKKKTDYLYF